MRLHRLSRGEWLRAIAVGVANAVLLSAVMVPAVKFGVSPLPKPLGLAFAETVLGAPLPLPVGLLFHLAWVTAWSAVYVALFRPRLSLSSALLLGAVLWLAVLVMFFPVVGWGFLGLAVSPKLIVASLLPHALFALFLWALCRLAFRRRGADAAALR